MMLPNGWKKVKLEDVADIFDGTHQTPDYVDEGVPFVSVENIEDIWSTDKFITKEAFDAYPEKPRKNDILMTRITAGIIGKTAIVDCDKPLAYYVSLALIRCKKDVVSPNYMSQYIEGPYFKKELNKRIIHTAFPKKINLGDIGKCMVEFPPIEEQKKIAATLSVWDSAIEKMEKLIESKETLLTEYGKDLFGKTEQKQNKNWATIALSEVLSEHGDKSTGEEEVFSVSVHKGLVNQIEHLGRSFAAKDTSNYNRVHYGDIVYTKSPTGDFPLGIVKQSLVKEDVVVSPLYGVFTPQTFELGVILDFYFSSPINANNYLRPVAQKGAKNTINITNKKFLSAKLRLPIDVKEQKKIAQFVQTTKKEMAVLQDILENYKKQKQGLMQKLLTGQWRVK